IKKSRWLQHSAKPLEGHPSRGRETYAFPLTLLIMDVPPFAKWGTCGQLLRFVTDSSELSWNSRITIKKAATVRVAAFFFS
ncbi:hypothetical protein, partial [Geomonas silvestris]|uniref:hypothetical protein n=1 Tax=Geomonas silvestris TaxID=2740184 RepID=UPI001AD92712